MKPKEFLLLSPLAYGKEDFFPSRDVIHAPERELQRFDSPLDLTEGGRIPNSEGLRTSSKVFFHRYNIGCCIINTPSWLDYILTVFVEGPHVFEFEATFSSPRPLSFTLKVEDDQEWSDSLALMWTFLAVGNKKDYSTEAQ